MNNIQFSMCFPVFLLTNANIMLSLWANKHGLQQPFPITILQFSVLQNYQYFKILNCSEATSFCLFWL